MVDGQGQGRCQGRDTAREFDDERLHGEDNGLVTGAVLQFTVVDGVREEDGDEDGQDAVRGEDEEARDEQQVDVVHRGEERDGDERQVADNGRTRADVEDLRRREELPEQREQDHHGQDGDGSAKGVEDGVAVVPCIAADIVLEEVDDEVRGDVHSGVDEDDGQDDDHGLVVVDEGLEHIANGGRLDVDRGLLLDGDDRDGLEEDEDGRDDEGEPGETDALIAGAQRLDGDDGDDGDEGGTDTGTGTGQGREVLTLFAAFGEGGDHGPEWDVHHGVGRAPEDVEDGRVGSQSGGRQARRGREHDVQDDGVQNGTDEQPGAELAPAGLGLRGDDAHDGVVERVEDTGHEQDDAHRRSRDAHDVLEVVEDIARGQHIAEVLTDRRKTVTGFLLAG